MADVVVVLELIARVRTCCENARWNKRSAGRVKSCVEAFEKVLERMRDKGTSENHKAAIWDLRGALGEAEAVLTRISGRSKVSAMRYAREDLRQLKDVEKRLAQASQNARRQNLWQNDEEIEDPHKQTHFLIRDNC